MIDERYPNRSSKPRLIKKLAPLLLVLPSVLIGILLVELFCRIFLPSSFVKNVPGEQRVIFFEGSDTIFENHGEIFTYVPHGEIRNLTAFFSESGDFSVEYDYRYRTNNLGLVQDSDVLPERQSLLLLGDSFTEGMGAEPWFRQVSPEIKKLGYQPINGGLMGTGFAQWLKLERYLADKNIRVEKLLVLFISFDYIRPVWHITPPVFQCLTALRLCHPEESVFYRLPPPQELPSWIAKVKTTRSGTVKYWLKTHLEPVLPVTYHIYKNLRERLPIPTWIKGPDPVEQQSRAAIAELLHIYGTNVAFMHLPQKDEASGPINLGLKARAAIQEEGGRLFDGFKLCGLMPADYDVNDDHPNSDGYTKIVSCVTSAVKEMTAGAGTG